MADKTCPLLVIDMQRGFVKNDVSLLVTRIAKLVGDWTGPIHYLRYKNYPGSMYARHLDWHKFMTSADHGIIPEIYKDGCEIHDHFGYAPPVELIAKLKGEKAVYVCGVDTDACVMAAVFALWDAEIRPVILAYYCTSSGGDNFHRAAIDTMLRQFGTKGIERTEVI